MLPSLRSYFAYACVCAALLLGSGSVEAQTTPTSSLPPGLDIVFIVDQSGSMWGINDPARGLVAAENDPGGNRVHSIRHAINTLVNGVIGNQTVFRITIVDFDSNVHTPIRDIELRYDPNNPGRLARRIEDLVTRDFGLRENGDTPFTNTTGALEAALRQFQQWGSSPDRRQVALVLTDGRPYVPDPRWGRDPVAALPLMREDIRRVVADMEALGVELWVIGLADLLSNYWNSPAYGLESDEAFWENVAGQGRARYAGWAWPDISKLVTEIVNGWLGNVVQHLPAGTYQAPPYIGGLAFNFEFNQGQASVHVMDPDGRVFAPQTPPGPQSRSARISIPSPKPGPYRFEVQGAESLAYAEVTPPGLRRLAPQGPYPEEPARIVLELVDDSGDPIAIDPDDYEGGELLVTSPSGAEATLPATVDPANGRIVADWTPAEPGPHTVRLSAAVDRGGDRGMEPLFLGEAHDPVAIDVAEGRPFLIAFQSPALPGEVSVLPFLFDGLDVTVGLVDRNGAPLTDVREHVVQPADWVSAQVIDGDGFAIGEPVPLTFDEAGGTWTGTVPREIDWLSGEAVAGPAELRLRIDARPGGAATGWVLAGVSLPPAAADLRVGGDLYSVGPIPLSVPGWVIWLALGLALVLVGAVIAFFILRALPGLLARSIDEGRKGALELIVFDRINDPSRLMPPVRQTVTRLPELKLDRKVTLEVDQNAVHPPVFRFKRHLRKGARARGKIIFRWPEDRRNRSVLVEENKTSSTLPGKDNQAYAATLRATA